MIKEESVSGLVSGASKPPEGKLGDVPPVKRNGGRGMLPTTWCGRRLILEYTDAGGSAASTSGVLLDWCALGVVMNLSGSRCVIPWERLSFVELPSD